MNELVLSNVSMPVIQDFGPLAASEPFYHMDRIADFNVMVYVTNGTIYVTEDETDYEINAGELLFLKKGVHHYGKRETERGTRWYYAHFYLDNNNTDIFRQSPAHSHVQEITLPKKLEVPKNSRAAHMIEEYNNDFCSHGFTTFWNVNSRLFDILTELSFMNRQKKTPQSLADRICEYLTVHCCEPFSAKELEHEFYLSYKYMAAVFKTERNLTMQQYHTKIRMNTACRLLRSTLMSVAEVASKVGYNDALYFSRCFSAAEGVSPSVYRRNITAY